MARQRQSGPDDVLMRLTPAPARRAAAAGVLAALGLWGLWVAAQEARAMTAPAVALAGLAAMAAAVALWRATGRSLILTEVALTDSRGRVLARIEDIRAVERGGLSLAPSGGFVLRLAAEGPPHWVPGLWWRLGTRVGIGGTTPRLATREMALLIEAMIAVRRRGSSGRGRGPGGY